MASSHRAQIFLRETGRALMFDKIVAAVCFVMMLPIMAIIAVVVAMTLGFPIFFIQERSGRLQEPFRLLKFRTMRDERDAQGELLPDAARISWAGSFLRESRFDELPGLINVMRGEMALVGPRPLLPNTIASMGPAGVARAAVRPGITGWAQVNGNTLLTNEEKVARDLWYIENKRWQLDVIILLRTILMVIGGERLRH